MTATNQPSFVSDLDTLIRARYPLLYLVSWEEARLDTILQNLAKTHGKQLVTWSITKGLKRVGVNRPGISLGSAKDPLEAIAEVEKLQEPSLVVLKDFHPFLSDPTVVRALRELAHNLKSTYTTCILLSPHLHMPPELEKAAWPERVGQVALVNAGTKVFGVARTARGAGRARPLRRARPQVRPPAGPRPRRARRRPPSRPLGGG